MFFPIRDDQPSFSTPFVNYFIIALNIVVFLFELWVEGQSRTAGNLLIFQFGAVPAQFTHSLAGGSQYPLSGTLLTLLTSMFLHAGFAHIIFNLWGLWIFGDNVEDYLGHFTYLAFYLACGVAAGLAHVIMNSGSTVPVVGASGAIAGVMGAYLLLYPRAKVLTWVVFIFFWWLPAWVPLLYWFVLQFLAGTASLGRTSQAAGGIAVWGHVGGFVVGMILIKLLPRRERAQRYASW